MSKLKKYKSKIIQNIILLCLLISFVDLSAEETKKWIPQIDLNIKYGNKRSLGRIGALAPLAQTYDMLTYIDFRFMADTRHDQEGNFGLGHRWLNQKKEYILGVYGYFDRRFSNIGNRYNQITFGAEYLSPTWDYRANVYIPENKIFTKKTYSNEVETSNLSGVQKKEITTEYIHTHKEIPLRGFDFEVGRSLPFLPNLRLYAGHYYYQKRAGVESIKGYQLRSTFMLNDYVSLQAETKYDNVRKKNHYIGLEIRIPIGKKDHTNSLTAIEKRMTESPIRDVDIVATEKETKDAHQRTELIIQTELPPEEGSLGNTPPIGPSSGNPEMPGMDNFNYCQPTSTAERKRKKPRGKKPAAACPCCPDGPKTPKPSNQQKQPSPAVSTAPSPHPHDGNCCGRPNKIILKTSPTQYKNDESIGKFINPHQQHKNYKDNHDDPSGNVVVQKTTAEKHVSSSEPSLVDREHQHHAGCTHGDDYQHEEEHAVRTENPEVILPRSDQSIYSSLEDINLNVYDDHFLQNMTVEDSMYLDSMHSGSMNPNIFAQLLHPLKIRSKTLGGNAKYILSQLISQKFHLN